MPDAPDAEIQLRDIFDKYPTHVERYRVASRAFSIRPGAMQDTVFRLWFDERHAEYEKEQRKKGSSGVAKNKPAEGVKAK
jgi:hypothetical protein